MYIEPLGVGKQKNKLNKIKKEEYTGDETWMDEGLCKCCILVLFNPNSTHYKICLQKPYLTLQHITHIYIYIKIKKWSQYFFSEGGRVTF